MATWPYPVRLDHMVELCGTYSAPDTSWTLPFNAEDAGIDTIVLSSAFGSNAGVIINTGLSVSVNDVTVTGDYSAGRVILGRAYNMDLVLTPSFIRAQSGVAVPRVDVRMQRVIARHQVGGDYQIIGSRSDRSNQGTSFTATVKTVAGDGEHKSQIRGLADDTTITFRATGPRPTTLVQARIDYRGTLK